MRSKMPTRTGSIIDEETALLPGGRGGGGANPGKGGTRSRAERGVCCNRVLIHFLIVSVVITNIRSRQQLKDIRAQLQVFDQNIQNITNTLSGHEEVIDRFNSSITNADVIDRMSNLETWMKQTIFGLEQQLETAKQEVSKELNRTVHDFSDEVAQAKKIITDEVNMVKTNVTDYVLKTQDQFSLENSFMVYQLAGTFTLLSCLISMWHMTAHLRKMNQPDVQRKILAILWMSPIYAVTSWFSLVFHSAEGYLAIIKDGYEAYIIYQFLSFCISVIGRGDRDVVVDVLARHAQSLTPPFRLFGCFEICGCCKPKPFPNDRALADAILLQCQGFALQFVLFRPLTTTAMVVLKHFEPSSNGYDPTDYGNGDGPTDYDNGDGPTVHLPPQFYITIVQNLSIFVAFTGLLKFYHAVDEELQWCRPLAKFLCIKGVVFMTFWQGLCISILAQTTNVAGDDKAEWALSAQNFLICLEMLLFSIAHFYCFPTDEWQEGYRQKATGRFGDTIALGDFFQDVKLILTSKALDGNDQQPRPRRRKTGNSSRSAKGRSGISVVPAIDTSGIAESEEEPVVCDVEQPAERGLEAPKGSRDTEVGLRESGKREKEKLVFKEEKATKAKEPENHELSGENCATAESQEPLILDFDRPPAGGKAETQVGPFIDKTLDGDDEEEYESDDDYSDDDDGYTETTMEDLNDDQQFVRESLKRSLGSAGDDPVIKEAVKRLLKSEILSPDFFVGSEAAIEVPAGFNSGISDGDGAVGDDEVSSDYEDYNEDEDDGRDDVYEDGGYEGKEEEDVSENVRRVEEEFQDAEKGDQGRIDENNEIFASATPVKTAVAPVLEAQQEEEDQDSDVAIQLASPELTAESQIGDGHLDESETASEDRSDAVTPKRSYQQKGLEFLAPNRMSIEKDDDEEESSDYEDFEEDEDDGRDDFYEEDGGYEGMEEEDASEDVRRLEEEEFQDAGKGDQGRIDENNEIFASATPVKNPVAPVLEARHEEEDQAQQEEEDQDADVGLHRHTQESGVKPSTDSDVAIPTIQLASPELTAESQIDDGHLDESETAREDRSDGVTSKRTYEQKGLEFLAPNRTSREKVLKPSLFTALANIDEATQKRQTPQACDHD